MADRRFTEVDVRRMLERADSVRKDVVEGRWLVRTRSAMNGPYLEVTFRQGRPLAAYYYLPRRPRDRAVRTERAEAGMLVDFGPSDRPIGIEMTAPDKVTHAAMNRVLNQLGFPPVTRTEIAPLLAA
jgi:hypothetical protein